MKFVDCFLHQILDTTSCFYKIIIMPSAAEIQKMLEEQEARARAMAAQLAHAEAAEEAARVAEEACRRAEAQAILDTAEKAERLAAEKAARKARRRAEKQRKEEEELMRGMGAVAGSSKRVEMEGPEETEEGADEACWNCRSRNITCKRIR